MRRILLFAVLPALALAQTPKEILERAAQVNDKNQELARSYTYLERQERRNLDGSDNVKDRMSQTWDVTPLEGSQYRRLVARDDKPLPADEEKKEQEKLRKSIEERRKETPEQRERRIAESQRRQDERGRDPMKELVEAFDLRVGGEEKLDGRDVWVIDASPHSGFKGKSVLTRALFPKMKCRFWIGKSDYQATKVDCETLDTVSLGMFVLRLSKGSRFTIELARVNDEVWLPKRVDVSIGAHVLLVKSARFDIRLDYSDYKKFQAESRVVSTGSAER